MAGAYTFTRTTTIEPEKSNIDVSSLTPPTRDEIIVQLRKHFEEHPKDIVTDEDIFLIADIVSQTFEKLRNEPYTGFAKYVPEKPHMTISIYRDNFTMFDRERYPADYSIISSKDIQCSSICFQMTVVYTTKWISLAYVANK